jgi:hypothetical protein
MAIHPIVVPPNGACFHQWENRNSGNTIFWCSATGRDFTIEFPAGSPFVGGQSVFPSGRGVTTPSQIDSRAALGHYWYNVGLAALDGTSEVHDPKIILNDGNRPPDLFLRGAAVISGIGLLAWGLAKAFQNRE